MIRESVQNRLPESRRFYFVAAFLAEGHKQQERDVVLSR
jgi:hypothetical protein